MGQLDVVAESLRRHLAPQCRLCIKLTQYPKEEMCLGGERSYPTSGIPEIDAEDGDCAEGRALRTICLSRPLMMTTSRAGTMPDPGRAHAP